MGVESHQYSTNGYFHNLGIDSMNTWANKGKWKMRRLSTIMEELKHTDVSLKTEVFKHFKEPSIEHVHGVAIL